VVGAFSGAEVVQLWELVEAFVGAEVKVVQFLEWVWVPAPSVLVLESGWAPAPSVLVQGQGAWAPSVVEQGVE
jgi:hypothetical protein